MIMKQYERTKEILQLEALDRRLQPLHPAKETVGKAIKKKKSGVRGEKEVQYPLGFLNGQQYLILHNLRLPDQNGFFQIDTLIMAERYILILEVKNWYGTIFFHENGQVTRIGDDRTEEGFPNPIPQAKLQQHRLRKWLNAHTTINIPLDFFVVISFSSTIIKSYPSNYSIPKEVIHNNQLFFSIQELDAIYPTPTTNMNQLMKLAKRLIIAHTPRTDHVLDKYNISKRDLIKGVFCPKCSAVPMIRQKRKWQCKRCNHTFANAHFAALNDYKLLLGDKISNREARDFLLIRSPYVVKHLLQKLNLKYHGTTNNRLYELKFHENSSNPELNELSPEHHTTNPEQPTRIPNLDR